MNSTIGQRIKMVRTTLRLTQTEFGDKVGLKQAVIGQMENGTRNVTDRTIILLCQSFNVNEEWIRSGIGEMFNPESVESLDAYADRHGVTAQQRELFKALMAISPEERSKFVERCRTIFAKYEQAAAIEEDEIEQDVIKYRQERLAEKNTRMLSASLDDDEGTA